MLKRSKAGTKPSESILSTLEQSGPRWRRQADLAGVSVALLVDSRIKADHGCLELMEVVQPVFDNAVRHAGTNGSVGITVTLTGSSLDQLQVDVGDTGPPIPADLAPRIFDAWFSGRDASVAGGLGLWLARESARDVGGDVVLSTDCDHPTTIRIHLPVGQVAER